MKKALLPILCILLTAGVRIQAQAPNVSLTVDFIDTWAIYTMADWEGNPNLFTITIHNSELGTVRWIMLEMEISVFGCADPSIPDGQIAWGVTYPKELGPAGDPASTIVFHNDQDFKYNQFQYDKYNSDFEDAVTNTGSSLPAGRYRYEFRLLYDGNQVPDYTQAQLLSTESNEIEITLPNDPELVSPGEASENGIPIYESNPTFQWLSTGAHSGSVIYYRILICNKMEGQSNDEAIQSLPFFEDAWNDSLNETGIPVPMNFTYPSSAENFYNGKYVWQVFARDSRNMSDPSAGYSGESQIFCFQYGDVAHQIYPPDAGAVNTVNPNFIWTMAMGAQGYQVRISGEDDPLVEPNYFEEDVTNTFIDHVPGGQLLSPGSSYYWKVRALPVGYWSEVSSFTCEVMAGGAGGGPEMAVIINPVNPTHPTFIWDLINGSASYQLYVSQSVEPNSSFWDVNSALTSIVYPDDAPPLQLGTTYYAWVQPLDGEGNPFGNPSVPTEFEIPSESAGSPLVVNLVSPVNTPVYSLNPVFTWDPVIGAANYGIWLYADADLTNLIWSDLSVPSTSVTYPGEAPELTFGNSYWWQVVAYNNLGEEMGDRSQPGSFDLISIIPILVYPVGVQVDNLNPDFSWEPIEGVFNFRIEVSASQDFSQILWNSDEITTNSVTYPATGATALEYDSSYWWRVTALNPAHIPIGQTSQEATFTTPEGEVQVQLNFGP